MESTFQVKDSPPFGEGDRIDERDSREMVVGPGVGLGVIGVHAQRAMKHHFGIEGSDFIHLDIVDNGVHVHDADVLVVPYGHHPAE